MGKPFVQYQDPVPDIQKEIQSGHMTDNADSGSDDLSQDENLNFAVVTVDTKSSPTQDALHAAETYFQQLEQRCNARHDPQRTLFEILVDEAQKPAGAVRTNQRTSIDDGNSNLPAETKATMFPTQRSCDLQVPSEFSLDDSDESDDCYESMCSPPAVSSSDKVKQEIAQGRNCPSFPVENSESLELMVCEHSSEEEHPHDMHDEDSKSAFEWNEILKSSIGRSRDSLSDESFRTGRSRICSTSSRDSLSDEAISERVAEWGNGVARLVLKNSSRDSTPRTSDGSSRDSFNYNRQIVPVVSKQIVPAVSTQMKDALSSVQLAFWVCDAIDPENIILYASAGFFDMTGYSPEEVIGRNCRFLHGVDTDANEVTRLSEALKNGEAYTGTLLNYKKNGAPFWNLLTLSPMSDDNGAVIKYMGMQAEVSNHSVAARRKKTAHDINCKDIVKSPCQSIAEFPAPSTPLPRRSEREKEIPVFTPPGARLTGTSDQNGRSQGSKRYSLTHGPRRSIETQGSKRYSLPHGPRHSRAYSMECWQQRPVPVEGSERHSVPVGTHKSLAPQQRLSKGGSAARPFYWLVTAAQILEDEIQQLGSNTNLGKQVPETIKKDEGRKGGANHNNKIGRVAKGVFGFFRKLERKLLKRKKSSVPSNRVSDYHSDSDSDIDDLTELPTMNNLYSEGPIRNLRSESMPHIDSIANTLTQADLRVRSSRFISSAMSDRFDREQFCIVHE